MWSFPQVWSCQQIILLSFEKKEERKKKNDKMSGLLNRFGVAV